MEFNSKIFFLNVVIALIFAAVGYWSGRRISQSQTAKKLHSTIDKKPFIERRRNPIQIEMQWAFVMPRGTVFRTFCTLEQIPAALIFKAIAIANLTHRTWQKHRLHNVGTSMNDKEWDKLSDCTLQHMHDVRMSFDPEYRREQQTTDANMAVKTAKANAR